MKIHKRGGGKSAIIRSLATKPFILHLRNLSPNSFLLKLKKGSSFNSLIAELNSLKSIFPNLQFLTAFKCKGEQVYPTNQIVLALKPNSTILEIEQLFGSKFNKTSYQELLDTYLIDIKEVGELFSITEAIHRSGLVEWVEPNLISGSPCNPLYPLQYYLNNTGQSGGRPNIDINAPEAWDLINTCASTNQKVRVAVLDDGIEPHQDLSCLLPNGLDVRNRDNPGRPTTFFDFHGQACAGIIGASANEIGMRGISTNVEVISGKVYEILNFDQDVNPYSANEIAQTISILSNPSFGKVDIFNISWGTVVESRQITEAIRQAIRLGRGGKGCIFIAAAGNNQANVMYPASLREVVAVGAIDKNGNKAQYSSVGNELDLTAVSGYTLSAGDIVTLGRYDNYIYNFNGTSAACPQVAGVAALLLQVNPNLTEAQVRIILQETARDLGEPGFDDNYGYGLVDAYAAVSRAISSNAQIVGPSMFCQTATFTLTNAPACMSVTWSVGSNITIVSSNANTLVVSTNVSNNTSSFIQAQVGGLTLTYNVLLTPPAVAQIQNIIGPTQVWRGQIVNYRINPVPGATGYRWWVVPVDPATSQPIVPYNCTGYFCWGYAPGHNGTGLSCSFRVGETDGQIYVEALGTNPCNSGIGTIRAVYQATGCPPNGEKCYNLRISNPYPNPTGNMLQVKIEHSENDEEVLAMFAQTPYEIRLYNAQGEQKIRLQNVQGIETQFVVSHLPQGLYHLKILHPELGILEKMIVKE